MRLWWNGGEIGTEQLEILKNQIEILIASMNAER